MSDTDQVKIDPKPVIDGFNRSQLKNTVEISLKVPYLYPSTNEQPFAFSMRLQLVREAEEVQSKFLMLSDDEQEAATHEYDAQMLSMLATKAPTGFSDFPTVDNDPTALRHAIYEYLIYAEGSPEEREGMAFICRQLVRRYRIAINPSDYL